jgi:hypothetical protein
MRMIIWYGIIESEVGKEKNNDDNDVYYNDGIKKNSGNN